jgi:hypothetical protein
LPVIADNDPPKDPPDLVEEVERSRKSNGRGSRTVEEVERSRSYRGDGS